MGQYGRVTQYRRYWEVLRVHIITFEASKKCTTYNISEC
jgi:hypothetical protein